MPRLLLSLWPLGFVLLGACHAESSGQEPLDSAVRLPLAAPFPVVYDTVAGAVSPLAATWLAQTAHRLLYIGRPQDTLLLQHTLTAYLLPPLRPGLPPRAPSIGAYALADEQPSRATQWKFAEQARLHLTLDTGQVIKAEEEWNQDLRTDSVSRWFAAYPVLVRSLEPDTILIGAGDYVPLEVEAQDAQGQWRQIEKPFAHFCGTGLPSMLLPPRQVALTSVLIPHGSFATQLRVRIGENYSLPFPGRIHPRQFESKFDQWGEYQAAYVREHPGLSTDTP